MDKSASLPARSLTVRDLAIERGGESVVENLSFQAGAGEALLVRGANGAGKSTLLLCLAGILHATAGRVEWHGRHEDDRAGADMHFVGHKSAIKSGLSVAENLGFWTALCGADRDAILPALDAAGLGHAADFDAGYLSAGQTRRLSLARLIAAPRPIWLLDEPTSALDAEGDAWVCGRIDAHLADGGMVIVATHLDLNLRAKARTLTLGSIQ